MVWVWKISPKNVKNFNFFPFGSKKSLWIRSKSTRSKAGQPLIYCRSKVSLSRVRAHLYCLILFILLILQSNLNVGVKQISHLVLLFYISLLVMGLGQNFLTWVGSGWVDSLWLGSGQPFMVWDCIWKISPKFFNFFALGQKILFGSGRKVPGSKVGWPLIYCGSKISLGRFGSGQGPSLDFYNGFFGSM